METINSRHDASREKVVLVGRLINSVNEIVDMPSSPTTQESSGFGLDVSQEFIVDGQKVDLYVVTDSIKPEYRPMKQEPQIPCQTDCESEVHCEYNKPQKIKYLIKCVYCVREFVNRANLLRHIRGSHNGERPYSCSVCDFSCAQHSNLLKHQLTHAGIRPYLCVYCSRSFSQKANLKKHELTHTGEHPFTCELCLKKFTQKSNLTKHILGVHEAKKMHTCHNCSKSFTQKTNLLKHQKNCIQITVVI